MNYFSFLAILLALGGVYLSCYGILKLVGSIYSIDIFGFWFRKAFDSSLETCHFICICYISVIIAEKLSSDEARMTPEYYRLCDDFATGRTAAFLC